MAVNYMVRINLNIALVSMVTPKTKSGPVVGFCTTQEYIDKSPQALRNQTVSWIKQVLEVRILYREI